jgi:hypothetical protein
MIGQLYNAPATLDCGDRVQVHDDTLQAFYGISGTVVKVCRCPRDGHVTRVDVQMDDLPPSEGHASFYPHELSVVVPADRSRADTPR